MRTIDDEGAYIRELLTRIVDLCPRRSSGSEDERRAAAIMAKELAALGLDTDLEPFEWNESLYQTMALHFGIGSLGTLISPIAPHVAFALHLLAGGSYFLDSTKRAHLLRRLLPSRESNNVVATLPAEGEPALRVVFLAHLDAAFTGTLFEPATVKRFEKLAPPHPLSFMRRGLALATYSQFALAGFDLLRMVLGPMTLPLRPLEHAIGVPGYIAFLANLQVVLKDEVVPGANDDLTGVVALPVLAARLAEAKPPEVELVFVATGCEEAGTGGALALAARHAADWDRDKTVIVGLDSLSNGELRYFDKEGEVVQRECAPWLVSVAGRVVAADPHYDEVRSFTIPVGGTDVGSFLARGYDGMCLGCIDPEIGSPRHYHLPQDTPENLDWDKIAFCVDFADAFVREIWRARLGQGPAIELGAARAL